MIGSGLDFAEIGYGFGRHQYFISQHQFQEYLKYSYGEWIQTFATLTWTKISISIFLLRIPVSKLFIRPLQAAIVILVVTNIVITLLWIFQCRPIHKVWNGDIPGQCFSLGQLQRIIISQASKLYSSLQPRISGIKYLSLPQMANDPKVISAISDFLLAAFPILILYKIQMSLRTKVGLCLLMGLGVVTGACCIVRTVLNWQSEAKDATYGGIDNWMWRAVEVNFGIVAACIPALRPGYKLTVDTVNSYYTKRSGSGYTEQLNELDGIRKTSELDGIRKTTTVDVERQGSGESGLSKGRAGGRDLSFEIDRSLGGRAGEAKLEGVL